MRLVIDTGILISALLKDSATREILLLSSIEFLLPDYAFEEFERHKDKISRRSGLSMEDIDVLITLITENITIVSAAKIKPYMEKANEMMGAQILLTSRLLRLHLQLIIMASGRMIDILKT